MRIERESNEPTMLSSQDYYSAKLARLRSALSVASTDKLERLLGRGGPGSDLIRDELSLRAEMLYPPSQQLLHAEDSDTDSGPSTHEATPNPRFEECSHDSCKPLHKEGLCSLAVESRTAARIAPAFRAYPSLPSPRSGQTYSKDDDANLIRQQLDDLEWLHLQGHKVEIDTNACDGRARGLLVAETFDVDLARQIAVDRRLSGDHFVSLLCIPDWLEVEMAQLKSNATKRRAREIKKKLPSVEAALFRSVKKPEQRRHVPRWLAIWHCTSLVGRSPTAIGRTYEAMTGVFMNKVTALKLRNEVEKRTPPFIRFA